MIHEYSVCVHISLSCDVSIVKNVIVYKWSIIIFSHIENENSSCVYFY